MGEIRNKLVKISEDGYKLKNTELTKLAHLMNNAANLIQDFEIRKPLSDLSNDVLNHHGIEESKYPAIFKEGHELMQGSITAYLTDLVD